MSYIELDKNKCKSCYLCIDTCPKKLITKSSEIGSSGNYVVQFKDEKKECLGCAMCAMICPDIAITSVYKDE